MSMTMTRVEIGHDADDRPAPSLLPVAMDWSDAACQGMDPALFFPERGAPTKDAKSVCRECTRRADCLRVALIERERFGIWGGFSERERRDFRRLIHRGVPLERVVADALGRVSSAA